MNKKENVDKIYLDFTKAFNKIQGRKSVSEGVLSLPFTENLS